MSFDESEGRMVPVPERNIDCQRMLAYSDVIHHGVLRKRRAVDKVLGQVKTLFKWKQIYVILRGGCIYFYSDETASKSHASSLYGFTSVERCDLEVPKEIPWPFKLVCALQETVRDYYFCAASEKDLVAWMKHIKEQIDFANGFSTVRRTLSVNHPAYVSDPASEPVTPPVQASAEKQQRPLPVAPAFKREERPPSEYVTESSSSEDEPSETAKQRAQLKRTQVKPAPDKKPTMTYEETPVPSGRPPNKATGNSRTGPSGVKLPVTPRPPVAVATIVGHRSAPTYNACESVYVIGEDSAPSRSNESASEFTRAFWDKDPEEAEEVMKSLGVEGAFMVRESRDKSSQTLMVCAGSMIKKYKIHKIDNKYSLEMNGPFFSNLDQLIDHFKAHNIPQRDMKLTKPYSTVATKR